MGLTACLRRLFGIESPKDITDIFTVLLIISIVPGLLLLSTEKMFTCEGDTRSLFSHDWTPIIIYGLILVVMKFTDCCYDFIFTLLTHTVHLLGCLWIIYEALERVQCTYLRSKLKNARLKLKHCFWNPTNCHSDYSFIHGETIMVSQIAAAIYFAFILLMHCIRSATDDIPQIIVSPPRPRQHLLEGMIDHDRERQQRRPSNDEIELGQIHVDEDPNPPVQDPRFLLVPGRRVRCRQPLRQVRGDDHLNSPRRRPRQVAPVDFHRAHDS